MWGRCDAALRGGCGSWTRSCLELSSRTTTNSNRLFDGHVCVGCVSGQADGRNLGLGSSGAETRLSGSDRPDLETSPLNRSVSGELARGDWLPGPV